MGVGGWWLVVVGVIEMDDAMVLLMLVALGACWVQSWCCLLVVLLTVGRWLLVLPFCPEVTNHP